MGELWPVKLFSPKQPGKYWVLRNINSPQGGHQVCDDGYAYWDGKSWSRTDFDFWYGDVK